MKIKIFTVTLLLFFFALPVFASTNENFDSYANEYNIDNESNWTYNYGDHLQVKSSNAYSAPNSLTHSDGNGSLNVDYNHGEDFDKFQIAIMDEGEDYGKWDLYFKDGTSNIGKITMTYSSIQWDGLEDFGCGNLVYGQYSTLYIEFTDTELRCKINDYNWSDWHNHSYNLPDKIQFDHNNDPSNTYFDDMIINYEPVLFAITDPIYDYPAIDDSWITVEGICPIDGVNRIGFTNDCLGFEDIEYAIDCSEGTFSGQFYKSGLSDWVIARDIESVSEDCVDYDDLMYVVKVDGFEVIEGYPDDWYFNFDYYNDYDIKIISPEYDSAVILPKGQTAQEFVFEFIYPIEQLNNLNFNIKQYDENGTVQNVSYHNKDLSEMSDTSNYQVTLEASQIDSLHYVLQLTENGEMKRQYPIAIYVSDLEFTYNPDDYASLFPRLVEELRKKIIFNYYFAFHDGFYNMFNGNYAKTSDTALDITFKSVSGDGEYNIDIKIFSASDPRVKNFANGVRPYIVAILWLMFATYAIFRITHLFSDNE